MTEYLNQIVTFLGDNPELAGIVVFLIAMGEALFIIGLFVPSTVVLVGAGALVGLGKLDPWTVFIWTTLGAIAGDAISYWVGCIYKDKLRGLWPLSRYPALMAQGEAFFRLHGGKSIFIGRFVPGVKSVVPGIAGMVGMNFWYFTFVNVTSAIAWSIVHLGPGFLAGTVLSAIGEVSGRLAMVLGGLCVILFVIVMLGRWLIQIVIPLFPGTHAAVVGWFARRPDRFSQWVARTFDPEHPRSVGMLASVAVLLVTMPLFFWLISEVGPGESLVQADVAIRNLFDTLRTPIGDRILVPVTMLGDGFIIFLLTVVVAGYLFLRKAWRRATGFLISMTGAALFVPLMKGIVLRERPMDLSEGVHAYSFPSGHATLTTVLFGIIAVLVAHDRSAWVKAGVFTITAIYVLTMGFSRVYLGVHWTTDVIAGLLFGTAMVSVFAFVFGSIHNEKIGRGVLSGLVAIALTSIGAWHITRNLPQALVVYSPVAREETLGLDTWMTNGWTLVSGRRIGLSGEFKEPLVIQYAGSLDALSKRLEAEGWRRPPDWTVKSATGFVEGKTTPDDLPTLPRTHNGRYAALALMRDDPNGGSGGKRWVLRLWPTSYVIDADGRTQTLFAGGLLREEILHPLGEFSSPKIDLPAPSLSDNPVADLPGAVVRTRPDGTQTVLLPDLGPAIQ
ncbi:bifunctional DedA family/phosphatase PAP2 family protein [Pannonibacter sp. SL95]|uniref:bifunctional DedA family/phosphatase PAP2 family protein n=1 Tax=Pannonibacter sp. SL95 TaxID=2995153 RepID=UPI002273C9F4|nr:bifunctional DedA family/phosphatase PAP2 family protein [Pannonibacter sp. SL95]MCY1706928.1 VTT domain-containing protein [Pannonibacter sp. SL95]